jgi:hypothetical protein
MNQFRRGLLGGSPQPRQINYIVANELGTPIAARLPHAMQRKRMQHLARKVCSNAGVAASIHR